MAVYPLRSTNGIAINKKEIDIINTHFDINDRIEFTSAETKEIFSLPVTLFGECHTYFCRCSPSRYTNIMVDRFIKKVKRTRFVECVYKVAVVEQPIECYRKLLKMFHDKGIAYPMPHELRHIQVIDFDYKSPWEELMEYINNLPRNPDNCDQ